MSTMATAEDSSSEGESEMTAPELLKAEMPMVRAIENELAHYGYAKGTAEYAEHFTNMLAFYRMYGVTFSVN